MENVRHYLRIYSVRKEMQDSGITNPEERYKKFTSDFVEKLQNMQPEDEVILKDNAFFDGNGKLIIELPE